MTDPQRLDDLLRGFHHRDGWYFRRDSDDGNVRIWKVRFVPHGCDCGAVRDERHGADCTWRQVGFRPVLESGPHVIPENEWASIVASVSRGGETGASWQFVRDFHNKEPE